MKYELFEATLIDELIQQKRKWDCEPIDCHGANVQFHSDSIQLRIGSHYYRYERNFLGIVKITSDWIDYQTQFWCIAPDFAKEGYISLFCKKYNIPISVTGESISETLVKKSATGESGTVSFNVYLNLQITVQQLVEIKNSITFLESQKSVEQLGLSFYERSKDKEIINSITSSNPGWKQGDCECECTVLISPKGVTFKFHHNIGWSFSDYNLRDLQSDDEMIGVGLAILGKMKSTQSLRNNKMYSFEHPHIKNACITDSYSLNKIHKNRYAIELTIRGIITSRNQVSDW